MDILSPNGLYKVTLVETGEIRFGPPLYSLKINGFVFYDRIFSNNYIWSLNSRFFVIMEWIKIGKESGLLVIDLQGRKECMLTTLKNGMIHIKQFENNKVIYVKERFGMSGFLKEFELDLQNLDQWKSIG